MYGIFFYLNWIFPTFFSLSHVSNPALHHRTARDLRKKLLLMFFCVILRPRFIFLLFFIIHDLAFSFGCQLWFDIFFPGGSCCFLLFFRSPKIGGCFASNRKKIILMMANNTPGKTKKNLFYFIIDWIFFWQNKKKHLLCGESCWKAFSWLSLRIAFP